MVSGTDNLEFQTKLYYLIRYYPEPIIKPFNFSVLISKRGIVIKYIKKKEKTNDRCQGEKGTLIIDPVDVERIMTIL